MVVLNDGQETAAGGLLDYLQGRTIMPYFTLSGGPGTGKTFMLKEVLRRSGIRAELITGATIAHAAKNVLKGALNTSIACFTVAQWLGLKMTYGDDGSIKFKINPKAQKKLLAYKVAILDEASMVDDELYEIILHYVTENNIKLIVVGKNIADIKPL